MDNFLNDKWSIEGNTFEGFSNAIKKIDSATTTKQIPMDYYYWLSVNEDPKGFYAVPLHRDESIKKQKAALKINHNPIEKQTFLDLGYDKDVVDQAFENGLFAYTGKSEKLKFTPAKAKKAIEEGKYIPVSEKALNTIASRISYGGHGFFSGRLIRDLAIADNFNKPIPTTIVERTDESGHKKVFAVMSNKYSTIKQEILVKLKDKIAEASKDDLGEMSCRLWEVNHSISRIFIEFPKASLDVGKEYIENADESEEMIPGLVLETSDIGDCALRVRGYFRVKRGSSSYLFYMDEEFTRIHVGEFNDDEIIKEVKNHVFPKYTIYPDKLAENMAIDVTTDHMSNDKKIEVMSKLYREISKNISLVKSIGKKREKEIIADYIDQINPTVNYTAYDMTMDFLAISKLPDLPNSTKESLYKCLPALFKFDFKEYLNTNYSEEFEDEEELDESEEEKYIA